MRMICLFVRGSPCFELSTRFKKKNPGCWTTNRQKALKKSLKNLQYAKIKQCLHCTNKTYDMRDTDHS